MTLNMPSLEELAVMTADLLPEKAFDLAFDEEGCLSSYWVLVDASTGAKEKIFTNKGRTDHDAYMHSTEFERTTAQRRPSCVDNTIFEAPYIV